MKLTSVGALVVGFWGVSIGMTVSTTRGINSSITSTSRGGIGDNRPGQSSTTTTERMLLFELKNGTKMGSMSLLATTQMKMMMSTSTERMKTGSPPMSGPRGNYKAATEGSEAGVTESVPRNGGRGCAGSRFLPKSMSENITKDCIDLIGFRMENFPPKEEDLVKVNYEDKCFSKCYLTELHYMTEADNLDPKRIFDDIRQETPQEKWPARHDAIKDCIKHTEDMASVEGGVSNSPCKYALVFFVCARESERRIIC